MSENEEIDKLPIEHFLGEQAKATVERRVNVSEQSLFEALQVRYKSDAYALFPQVRETTGSACTRTADAIAFGLWPSRGMEVEGFEIKISRGDWLRELKSPSKAEGIFQFCDRWWIV